MKKVLLGILIAGMVLLCATPATATSISDPWFPTTGDTTEVNLYEIYNDLYGTTYTDSNDIPQVSPDEVANLFGLGLWLEATARYAGLGQQFGYYQPTSGGPVTYTQLFNIQDPNVGHFLSGFTATIWPVGDFGFYDLAGGTYWHSQPGLNPGGEDHMIALYTPDPYTFLLAWEDLPFALADRDYNDLVVEIRVWQDQIIPEPTSMALLGMGIAGIVVRRLRGRKTS